MAASCKVQTGFVRPKVSDSEVYKAPGASRPRGPPQKPPGFANPRGIVSPERQRRQRTRGALSSGAFWEYLAALLSRTAGEIAAAHAEGDPNGLRLTDRIAQFG